MGKIESFMEKHDDWREGLQILRSILQSTELEETLKWGAPTYVLGKKNVVGLAAFKSYFGLWFFQGVFLEDATHQLTNAQEGSTQALRQWRFTSADQIDENLVRTYIDEAIENQKQGKEVAPKSAPYQTCEELQSRLDADPDFKNRFAELTPGRRKEYARYICEAKRMETRLKRLEKCVPLIISGQGLHDQYRK